MNTCGTCKFFGPASRNDPRFHPCELIKHGNETHATEADKGIAFVEDGSGYYAALCVKDEFGCNQWEAAS